MKMRKLKNDCENAEHNEVIESIIENTCENNEPHAVNAEYAESTTPIALVSDKGEN